MTKCKDCKYWRMSHTVDNYGECHRRSPPPSTTKAACWPVTHVDDECGEGELRQLNDDEWSVTQLQRLKWATEKQLNGNISPSAEECLRHRLGMINDKLIVLDPDTYDDREVPG